MSAVTLADVHNILTWPRNLVKIVLNILRICFIGTRRRPGLVEFLVLADVDTEGDDDDEGEDDDNAQDDDHHPVVTMA